jgi:WhiB family transcriptional regulator, redox-sensing transcriptional regulator
LTVENWREYAECRNEDPELFFPAGTTGPAVMQTELAKSVCRRCTVQEQCLRMALSTEQTSGIWGGTTETERRALRRREAAREARYGTGARGRRSG